jgi:hypothetical protein
MPDARYLQTQDYPLGNTKRGSGHQSHSHETDRASCRAQARYVRPSASYEDASLFHDDNAGSETDPKTCDCRENPPGWSSKHRS